MTALETVKDWMDCGVGDDPPSDAIYEIVHQLDAAKGALQGLIDAVDNDMVRKAPASFPGVPGALAVAKAVLAQLSPDEVGR